MQTKTVATIKQRWRPWSKLRSPRYIRSEGTRRLIVLFPLQCLCTNVTIIHVFAWCSTKCEPTFRWNRPKPVKGKSSLWWTLPATWVSSLFLFDTVTLSNLRGECVSAPGKPSSSLLLCFRFSCSYSFFHSISPPRRFSWRVTLSTWEETIGRQWSCWTVPTLQTTLDPSRQVTTVVPSSE